MSPKEKALELFAKFSKGGQEKDYYLDVLGIEECKFFALIAVDEMIESGNLEPQLKRHIGNVEPNIIHLEFWFMVKKEIQKL